MRGATYLVQRQSAYRASYAGFAREMGNFDDRSSLAPEYSGELGDFPAGTSCIGVAPHYAWHTSTTAQSVNVADA